jgi:quercetin dioxygenase-like cupin family protein
MDIKRIGSRPSAKGPSDWFTGTVRIDPLFQAPDPAFVQGASVTFEPGARTAWHTHPLGQTLIVTAGCGRAQRQGGPIEEIHAGDVVWFSPGEKHWHGAAPTAMTHIAIQEKLDGKVVDWMVAADYRINTYFRDPQGVWVNLYIPSTLRWMQDGARIELTQRGSYPFDDVVQFEVKASQARDFAVNFRIPAWAAGASVLVNSRRVETPVVPGSFAAIHRPWKSGDRVELDLPMTLRLEAIDPRHPQTVALKTVALMFGPIVLFAITDDQPSLSRTNLLAARRVDKRTWRVETGGVPMKMLPFIEIADEQYSTYLRIS